jgi:hypothetical protein
LSIEKYKVRRKRRKKRKKVVHISSYSSQDRRVVSLQGKNFPNDPWFLELNLSQEFDSHFISKKDITSVIRVPFPLNSSGNEPHNEMVEPIKNSISFDQILVPFLGRLHSP